MLSPDSLSPKCFVITDYDLTVIMGRTIPSFRQAVWMEYMEHKDWKSFRERVVIVVTIAIPFLSALTNTEPSPIIF
jgi:hypothetical protein